ncbi:uncharacterized protein LOC120536062 isoform X2 [Polypterus senegalus]|nr:uncharacterized protein LOC120536062 isoform X2 [Polypterus senegalus]XP_039620342.1 uncharacterized protein LOC120536062 isoform X2 [Polypterus senegalus]
MEPKDRRRAAEAAAQRDKAAYEHFTRDQHFADSLVDSLISDMLVDELIPDVLAELFSRPSLQVSGMDKTQAEGQRRFAKHLQRFPAVPRDQDARAELAQLVDSHLTRAALNDCTSTLVSETVSILVPALVQEAMDELAVDTFLEEDLIPEVVEEEVRMAVRLALSEHTSATSQQQLAQVRRCAANRLMDSLQMDGLLDLMAAQDGLFSQKQQAARLLDGCMLELLCHQYLASCLLRDTTLQNRPIRRYHRRLFSQVALEAMLTRLEGSLQEDAEDWLEYEKDMQMDVMMEGR